MLGSHSRDTAFPPSKDVLCPAGQMLKGKTAAAVNVTTCPWLQAGGCSPIPSSFWRRSPLLVGDPAPPPRPGLLSSDAGVSRSRGPQAQAGQLQHGRSCSGGLGLLPLPGGREPGGPREARDGDATPSAGVPGLPSWLSSSNVTRGSPKSASSWCPGPLPPPTAPKLLSSRLP